MTIDKLKGCGKVLGKKQTGYLICGIDFYCPYCLAKFKGRKEALEEEIEFWDGFEYDEVSECEERYKQINSELEELNGVLK